MSDKEIELKFKISKEQREKIINKIKPLTTALPPYRMVDTYYIPNFKDFEIDGKTIECIRIREIDNTSIICYKHIHYEADPIYCDEYETEIESKEQMEKILFALGFNIQMTIDKTRVSYQNQHFEFDFDTVDNLGELMEIELKDSSKNIDDILNFVSEFGLSQSDVTYEGIQLMMKKAIKNQK